MKLSFIKAVMVGAITAASFTMASCSDEPKPENTGEEIVVPADKVPKAVVEAFNKKYADAKGVVWTAKSVYWIANFESADTRNGIQKIPANAAWFTSEGEWRMTEIEGHISQLPPAVQEGLRNSKYADWKVDDEIDIIYRNATDIIYVIDVEGRIDNIETEVDLYFTADGVLFKEVVEQDKDYDYEDMIFLIDMEKIAKAVESLYPGAIIVDKDQEDKFLEVTVIDNRVVRDIYFDSNLQWIRTETEIGYTQLPQAVVDAVKAKYDGYRFDDIEHVKLNTLEEFYRIDLESRNGDVTVEVSPDGATIKEVTDGDDNLSHNNRLPDAVKADIEKRYPGATIKDVDYDHGYLEVEILHNGVEKDVYFTGSNEWVRTETDVKYASLEEAVKTAISQSAMAKYEIDDITLIESPAGEYYLVEFDDVNSVLKIKRTGEII